MATAAPPQPRIGVDHRMLLVGGTGSGKSTVGMLYFLMHVGRKVFIDPKREANIPGARIASKPSELRLDEHPTWIYRPARFGRASQAELDEVYAYIMRFPGTLTLLDESGAGITDPNRSPEAMERLLTQGRSNNMRHIALTQRPVSISMNLRATADHILVWAQGFHPRDLDSLAAEMGLKPAVLQGLLERQHNRYGQQLGRHSFIHFDRNARKLYARPPLPQHLMGTQLLRRVAA